MTSETEIAQLQLLQQNIQSLLLQKQQFQKQLTEFESALLELKDSEVIYRIIGNIMVASKKADVEKDLKQKKEVLDLRLNSIDKQEKMLKQRMEETQKKVLEGLKQKK